MKCRYVYGRKQYASVYTMCDKEGPRVQIINDGRVERDLEVIFDHDKDLRFTEHMGQVVKKVNLKDHRTDTSHLPSNRYILFPFVVNSPHLTIVGLHGLYLETGAHTLKQTLASWKKQKQPQVMHASTC